MTVRGLANLTKNTQLFESIQKYQRWKEMTYTNYLQTPKIHVCILISTWKSKVDNTLSEGITNINIYHILSHARILRKQIFHY
jgi:L-ribulose-5-phosphate 3-epimerase UlaE